MYICLTDEESIILKVIKILNPGLFMYYYVLLFKIVYFLLAEWKKTKIDRNTT